MAKLKSGDMVKIIKAPKEVPYLEGMIVKVVYPSTASKGDGLLCVKTPNGYTHIRTSAVEKAGRRAVDKGNSLGR